jgi:hypothetical protein
LEKYYKSEFDLLSDLARGDAESFREFALADPDFVDHVEGYGLVRDPEGRPNLTIGVVADCLRTRTAPAAPGDEASERVTAELQELLRGGESEVVEFKETFRWNVRTGAADKAMPQQVVKAVAGMLNAAAGGTVLVGVADDRTVHGLQRDLKTLGQRQTHDGLQNELCSVLSRSLGAVAMTKIAVDFPASAGVHVCRIRVAPSEAPVYVMDGDERDFYLRTNASTRKLRADQFLEYVRQRWPN